MEAGLTRHSRGQAGRNGFAGGICADWLWFSKVIYSNCQLSNNSCYGRVSAAIRFTRTKPNQLHIPIRYRKAIPFQASAENGFSPLSTIRKSTGGKSFPFGYF